MNGRAGRELTRSPLESHRDPDIAEKREAFLDEQDDWKGDCKYCKQSLVGTRAQLAAHRCREYEAHLESVA